MPDTFAARLRAARLRAKLSQRELSERSGLPANTIKVLEAGRAADPKLSTLRALAKGLACDVCELAHFR